MQLFPFKFREIGNLFLVTNDAGDFFFCKKDNLVSLIKNDLSEDFKNFLIEKNFLFREKNDFDWNNYKFKILKRKKLPEKINYFMIIPTLRCDLKCSYCQVSRVDQNLEGYDWSQETLKNFYSFVEKYGSNNIKIEFQGGEPTLRTDVISDILEWTKNNSINAEIVICTNLMNLTPNLLKIIEDERVFISTSLDGHAAIQSEQRTSSDEKTSIFFKNFNFILDKYGRKKISALPTFSNFDNVKSTIDKYRSLGLKEIFLRPVNFQGFARKKFPESKSQVSRWLEVYFKSIEYIFEENFKSQDNMIEFGLRTNLKRIFNIGYNGHLDLRNPNFAARDNFVIDYDGKIYPSDESRMISRIGIIDLSIGNLVNGLDKDKIDNFNWNQISDTNADCLHCTYQSYCGVDSVDDLSRYNRIDLPKYETSFCQSHISKFDDIFTKLISNNPANLYNISGHLNGIFNLNPPFGRIVYD